MVYITGDIHGNPQRIVDFCGKHALTSDDVIVVLGDVGANYYLNKRDEMMKSMLSELAPTIFCIHGNHEARPENIPGYTEKLWNGGCVLYQEQYPNILFPIDGECFNLNELRCLVIGGAYSVDKFYRQARGWAWWEGEQPSAEIKATVEANLKGWKGRINVVFSHTCPEKYTPIECFIPGIDQSSVDRSTEEWLDKIEEMAHYRDWYCGHWHINKRIEKMHFLYDDIEILGEGPL